MGLLPGSRLGPYEITGALGTGGMGEVYRARDGRIGRDVAIKVLPATFSEHSERVQRFQREAHAAGVLNHPNILAVYDVGTDKGVSYIVSELLEGETLRAKLRSGALPIRKGIGFALQIVQGLAAAHEKGITHRDLKPENLFVTKDDRIKILDFGLAKLTEKEPLPQESSALQTVAAESEPGTILGTVGYMSPEQVRGLAVDHRSDIFSLGAILYEMFTGQRAFSANTPADAMSAILQKDPPDLPAGNPKLAPAAERIVRHCLEKDAALRFQSARDVAFALEALSGVDDTSASRTGIRSPQSVVSISRQKFWIMFFALGAVVVVTGMLITGRSRVQTTREVFQLSIIPPPNTTLSSRPVLSADGSQIIFLATDPSGRDYLWLRSLNSSQSLKLAGTEDAQYPFWSPDGEWIAFFATGKLKKMRLPNSPPQILCNATDPRGGTWNREGTILFAPFPDQGLYRISSAGGNPIAATLLAHGESSHRFPIFLPNDRDYLFYLNWGTSTEDDGIYFGSLGSSEKKRIVAAAGGIYMPPGYLFFQQVTTLFAQTYDLKQNRLIGEPVSLIDQITADRQISGTFGFSAASSGIACVRGDMNLRLAWYDRLGRQVGSSGDHAIYSNLALSPDGKRIVATISPLFSATTASDDLWVLDSWSESRSRLTFGPAANLLPIWSPDGTAILFSSARAGPYSIYIKDASGSGEERTLVKTGNWLFADDWSRDGRFILYEEMSPKTNYDLWVLPMYGDKTPFPLLNSPSRENQGKFSPNAKYFAYNSDVTGRPEIYVQTFPDVPRGKWQISTGGGAWPYWSRDGSELFYLTLDKKLMAVDTTKGFHAATSKVLFSNVPCFVSATQDYQYAVSPDAQRFLIITPVEDPSRASITIITNWQDLLKK